MFICTEVFIYETFIRNFYLIFEGRNRLDILRKLSSKTENKSRPFILFCTCKHSMFICIYTVPIPSLHESSKLNCTQVSRVFVHPVQTSVFP